MSLEVTVLGCGTSTGVPLITCMCKVCRSRDPKNHRTRASILVKTQKRNLIIDTSTDLRFQALREKILRVDAVLFTHPHSDHISGIDELRAYNFSQKARIPVYGNLTTKDELFTRYKYIFVPGVVEGGGIPLLDFTVLPDSITPFEIEGIKITPIPAMHGTMRVLGFRMGKMAYLTDCSYVPEASVEALMGLSVLLLDCVREKPHATHFNTDQALGLIERVKPKKTYLTHLGHDFDFQKWNKKLPKSVRLAYDGMKFRIP